jgi:hypothetical protein
MSGPSLKSPNLAVNQKQTGNRKKVQKLEVDPTFTEGTQEESFSEWIKRKLNEIFVDNIPLSAIKDLPIFFMYSMGAFAYVLSITCFIYFIVVGYQSGVNTKFIALSGSTGDARCEPIPRGITGTYYATVDGYWSGENNFQYSNAIYTFDMFNYQSTTDQFRHLMLDFKKELASLGELAQNQNAGENLLTMMAWQSRSKSFTFQTVADPISIFDRFYCISGLATYEGTCNIKQNAKMNPSDREMVVQYSHSDFMSSSGCTAAVDPSLIGYDASYDFDDFRIRIDVFSALTALSVRPFTLLYSFDIIIIVLNAA